MTILYPNPVAVKSAPRKARRFAAGLIPSAPHFTVADHTVSDAAWLLADEIRRMEDEADRDAEYERETILAAWAEMDRLADEARYDELCHMGVGIL